MASKWRFSPDEIRAKLAELGYHNIPDEALKEFSNDLHQLIARESGTIADEVSSTSALNTSTSTISSETSTISNDSEASTCSQRYQPETDHRPLVTHQHYHQYIVPEKENQVESTNTSLRLAQKRKVLRHKDGKSRVFDESFSNETSATDISDMEERLQNLPLKEKDDVSNCSEDQSGGSSSLWHVERNRNVLPSFIRPRTGDPNSRGIRRTDPVTRYHEFKEEWRAKKVPGEKTHKNLRWSTRAQMLQHETFEKPQHRYIPNNYVAPTEKKRQALRWEVRSALANH